MKIQQHSSGPRTLFVCVRNRHGKGASCAGSGALVLLKGMRAMLAEEEIGPDELAVRPSGCLGLCKQGPVMVAAGARVSKPSKPRKKQKKGVWRKVEPGEMREVLREALFDSL